MILGVLAAGVLSLTHLCWQVTPVMAAPPGIVQVDTPQPLATLTIGSTDVRLNGEKVVDLLCLLDNTPCSPEDLAALTTCGGVGPMQRCARELRLGVKLADRDGGDPESPRIRPLFNVLNNLCATVLGGTEPAVAADVASGERALALSVDSVVPHQLLWEVLYTASKVGRARRGSLADRYTLSLVPPLAHPHRWPLWYWTMPREVRMHDPGLTGADNFSPCDRVLRVTVMVGHDATVVEAFEGCRNGRPLSFDETLSAKAPERQRFTLPGLKRKACLADESCGECTGPEYRTPDLAGLYVRTVKLEEAGRYPLYPAVVVGAEPTVPVRDLFQVLDAVMYRRKQNKYEDFCTFRSDTIESLMGTEKGGIPAEGSSRFFTTALITIL